MQRKRPARLGTSLWPIPSGIDHLLRVLEERRGWRGTAQLDRGGGDQKGKLCTHVPLRELRGLPVRV